jgi:hypothetical protein
VEGKTTPIAGRHVTVKLAAGSGARLNFAMKRYASAPTFQFPWNQ